MPDITKWNIQVHGWLKYHVMLRLMDKSKPREQIQLGPMITAFVVSSVWHGTKLGFCIFFTTLAVLTYFFKTA